MGKSEGKGFGVASLVFGILAVVFTQFIIISTLSAVIAIIFGIIGKQRGDKGLSKAGTILGVCSLTFTLLLFLFLEVLDVSIFYIPSWYR